MLVRASLGFSGLWLLGTIGWIFLGASGSWFLGALFALAIPFAVVWLRFLRTQDFQSQLIWPAAVTIAYLPLLTALIYWSELIGLYALRTLLSQFGCGGAFFMGLAWAVYYLEIASRRRELLHVHHLEKVTISEPTSARRTIWNPIDPAAWYYGRKSQKLKQSTLLLVTYSIAFWLAVISLTQVGGCGETYEMPAGGGEQKTVAQTVRIQKVIRKKFVVNPFSAIKFEVPPIDEVKLELQEVTEHAYKIGYGEGSGAGFAGGTKQGKVRFIRLEYDGGDWDQDFGVGGDMNMLFEYGLLTSQKVSDRTESRRVLQLASFPPDKSPPLVYLTGQGSINFSNSDIKTLREYLVDKHGMLFIDNGGSRHFHNQAIALINRVLPEIRPVAVPLDDTLHRVPFQIGTFPYVAPHGGKEALGWSMDGRWLVYYHPGDIGDAWSDGHAGVSPEVYNACYQLGANVINYAHSEYAKWLAAQQSTK